jgi:RNA polymerase sigma-70 factor (ECF subfamily)
VQRARAGDQQAFGDLVARYRDMAYGLGYHLTGDFEAARDLAQEGFIQAYLRLSQLRDPERFAGWLRRIVVNVHLMERRRGEVPTTPLADEGAHLRQQAQPSEIEVVVREALHRLREPERLTLTLHYVNGYTQAEIGSFLGVSRETVKTRLARARKHLREEVTAMVEDTFESKRLPAEFTEETLAAAIRRAEAHLRKGRVRAAIEEYEGVLQGAQGHVPALVGLGMAHQAAGQDEEALRHLRRAVEADPANQIAWGKICQILGGHREKWRELAAVYEKRLTLQPEAAANFHSYLADVYSALGEHEAAERHIRRALETDPENIDAKFLLGGLLARQGRPQEALAALEEVAPRLAQRDPAADEWNRFQLAHVQCFLGNYDRATDAARSVLLDAKDTRCDRIVERCARVIEWCCHQSGRLDQFPAFCRSILADMKHRGRADRLRWYLALFLESNLHAAEAMAEFERLGAISARCWRVAVPFDNRDGRGMATAYPPEQEIALDDPDVGRDGRRIRWQQPMSEGSGVELNFLNQAQVGPICTWVLGYAVLQIMSPARREAAFRFGASGWTQVWLNGESLFLQRTFTGVPDGDRVPLKLKRGKNDLLVKVGVQEPLLRMRGELYYWSLFSRITDARGEPMRDLRFPLGEQ